MKTLPVSFLLLEHLNSFEASNNNLTGFYSEYQLNKSHVKLVNLTYLNLNGNQLDHIPQCFKYLTGLRHLHLHQNRISDISELCRRNFDKLEILDLGQNKLSEIPIALVHFLVALTGLTVTNNDLLALPPLLGLHRNIQ